MTPTVIATKNEKLIYYSEGLVGDEFSAYCQPEEETKSGGVMPFSLRTGGKAGMIAPTLRTTESDTTIENFANMSMATETRVSHLSAAKKATSSTLYTVKESLPKRSQQ